MLFDLAAVLGSKAYEGFPKQVRSAIVESACLHTRILIDILASKDSGTGDDLCLTQLLPGFRHASVDDLKREYGHRSAEGSPCWTLNKMMMHPTLLRGPSYDYTDLLKKLLPLIEDVLRAIHAYQQDEVSKLPKTSPGIYPGLQGKTSS